MLFHCSLSLYHAYVCLNGRSSLIVFTVCLYPFFFQRSQFTMIRITWNPVSMTQMGFELHAGIPDVLVIYDTSSTSLCPQLHLYACPTGQYIMQISSTRTNCVQRSGIIVDCPFLYLAYAIVMCYGEPRGAPLLPPAVKRWLRAQLNRK